MKKKFLAFLLALFLFFPSVLSACSLSDLFGSGTNSTTETVPTMTVIVDEYLTQRDGSDWYYLTLDVEESYKVNISLGDYEGTKYYVCFVCSTGEDNVTLDSDGTITAKSFSQTKHTAIHVGIKEQDKNSFVNGKYEIIYVTINPSSTVISQSVTISFANNSDMKFKS